MPDSMIPSRSVGRGASSTVASSGEGSPYPGSPVLDMIDVSVSTREGCSMAMVWAIMPPMDAPMRWAFSMPR